jgi:uncharacterized protein YhbP (UPF0306 family)
MNPKTIAADYLQQGRVMQIASLHDGSPRVNSVYYVPADDLAAVYWMSEPRRRHSEDILKDTRMAGAIAIKTDWPVAGVQFTGKGSVLQDQEKLQKIIAAYNEKYHDAAKGLYERIQDGTNKHLIYELALESLELFDGVNFPGGEVVSVL